ncbi:hypothetical protein PIB30_054743 [Stylosanthes scabra]|uniref:Legume lectin domain-containing protein n=1 Tax=Stylosanthes scabra TaxID=79078 RepID=A0ABU6TJF9_9FABA|nr:hypothetical protein [Stylosanthes scabra]
MVYNYGSAHSENSLLTRLVRKLLVYLTFRLVHLVELGTRLGTQLDLYTRRISCCSDLGQYETCEEHLAPPRAIPLRDSISFSFINFEPDERNLILQGYAEISPIDKEIKLTRTNATGYPQPFSVGRVLHSSEVRLWERGTNRLASFETQFSFYLTSPIESPADGIAFFVAPSNTTIPPNYVGGTLGLFPFTPSIVPSPVVAVEFDTFFDPESNPWDPNFSHIGLDFDSIRSSYVIEWPRREGELVNVLISYNPTSKTLTATATYPDGQQSRVSGIFDLRNVLPEWVRVGFSAASGLGIQTHNLVSWSFTSTLLNTAENENELIKLARGA